ncbi:MAG: methionyl-tRNA formyltransferase [Dehalococcoidia bacterium]|nr:methionyl-tRNA formyltransferase [Dehalococcoidia bacterium]
MPLAPAATRVVFMGSPAFALPSLHALLTQGYVLAAVVTQPDRPAGRGGRLAAPPVKLLAQDAGVLVLQPETLKDERVQAEIASLSPDVVVVAAYGKILPKAMLAIPQRGNVNVHASLLPRWRGASPVAAAILAGDAESGVTIMEMAPKMDAGAVITQARTSLGPEETAGSLEARLADLGARELLCVLPAWLAGDLRATPQDEAEATYCGLLQKKDGHLQATMTAEEASRAVRAYNPWPGAFVLYRGERLAVWAAHTEAGGNDAPPGTTAVLGRHPAVAFRQGWLVLDEVQRTGARRLRGDQFLHGERGTLDPWMGLA